MNNSDKMADETAKRSAGSAISGNKKQTLILTKNRMIKSVGGFNPIVKNASTGNISKVGSTHNRPTSSGASNTQNKPQDNKNNLNNPGKSKATTPTTGAGLQVQIPPNGGHAHAQTTDTPGQHPPQHLSHGPNQVHAVSSSDERESSSEVVSSSAGSQKKQQKGTGGEKAKTGNKKKKTASGNVRKKNSASVHKTTNKLQRAMLMNAKKRQIKKQNARQTASRPMSSSDAESGVTETKSMRRGQMREQLIDPEIDAKKEMQCPRCLNEVKPTITGEPSRDTHIISLILCCLCLIPCMFMPYWFNCKSSPVKRCPKCGAYLTEPPVRLNCEKTPPDSSDE